MPCNCAQKATELQTLQAKLDAWETVFSFFGKDPLVAGEVMVEVMDLGGEMRIAATSAAEAIEQRKFGGTGGYPYAEAIRAVLGKIEALKQQWFEKG
jgi:hypothetical protein